MQALNFVPYNGEIRLPDDSVQNDVIVGAVYYGRQTGGNQQLAPKALIDDGLLDIVEVNYFTTENLLYFSVTH